jgi:hypothetical protein
VADKFLAYLLDIFVEDDFSVEITLLTNGMLVSGQPITEEEYFGLVAELFEAGFKEAGAGQEAADAMKGFIAGLGMRRQEAARARVRRRREQGQAVERQIQAEAENGTVPSARSSIHLKDVAIAGGGLAHVVDLPFWRGQLSEIAGWSFGRIEQDGDDGELDLEM